MANLRVFPLGDPSPDFPAGVRVIVNTDSIMWSNYDTNAVDGNGVPQKQTTLYLQSGLKLKVLGSSVPNDAQFNVSTSGT